MDFLPALILLPTLLFAFMNGANDSGTMAASVVSSRCLSPRSAVLGAAVASFLGAILLGSAVARTLGSGLIYLDRLAPSADPLAGPSRHSSSSSAIRSADISKSRASPTWPRLSIRVLAFSFTYSAKAPSRSSSPSRQARLYCWPLTLILISPMLHFPTILLPGDG